MTSYLKKWPVIIVAAVLAAIFFFIQRQTHSLQAEGVKELTLSPTDVVIPRASVSRAPKGRRYYFEKDGDQYHLFFLTMGTSEKVIGDLPTFTKDSNLEFEGFTDVVSPSGTTTYASYTRYKGQDLVVSELYALKGNRAQKLLSNVRPAGINSLDKLIFLDPGYLDQRDNLYVLTRNATLCLVRDGQVIAKADVSGIGAQVPAIPSMFSDADNTYFLVPKLRPSGNSATGFGPVTENQIKGKYKINLPRQ
jgi:hypothetical protein